MKKFFRPITFALSVLFLAAPMVLAGCDQTAEELSVPLPPAIYEEEPIVPAAPAEEQKPTEQPKPQTTPKPKPEPEPKPETAKYVSVKTNGLNVRAGAGTGYMSLGQAEKGELLAFRNTKNGWYETRYRGNTAYVSASAAHAALVTMEKGSAAIENVILKGLDQLGVPYVYGAVRLHDGKGNKIKGFTTTKFDCSSLMQYIFYEGANVLLGTTTRTQVLQGKSVKTAELKRGDLLFFTNASRKNNTGIERVGHVALYLGDNYILHTASDYAKIEQISSSRWNYFLEARRVL